MTERRSGGIVRVLRPALTLAAIVAVIVTLIDAVRQAGEVPLPQASWVAWSIMLAAAAVGVAGCAWMVLLEGPSLRELLPGFAVAQLAKYVPGSVWQGVSQVLDAELRDVSRARASFAYLLQLWTQLVAAGIVAGLVLLGEGPRWPWIVLAAAVLAASSLWLPLLARLGTLVRHLAAGRFPRLRALPAGLPSQHTLLSAMLLGVCTIVLGGAGYASLLVGPTFSVDSLAVVGAFAVAWAIGFLVVPLPAGIGVREFILLGLVGHMHGTAAVLAAAVAYRLVTLVAELLLVLIAVGGLRRRRVPRNLGGDPLQEDSG